MINSKKKKRKKKEKEKKKQNKNKRKPVTYFTYLNHVFIVH